MVWGFPNFLQLGTMDCGPVCLQIVCASYKREFPLELLRERCRITKLGVSLYGIAEAAESIGLRTIAAKVPFEQLIENRPFPCIVHWKQNHFVVLYKISRNHVFISDPARGLLKLNHSEFLKNWSQNQDEGVALLLEPSEEFWQTNEKVKKVSGPWKMIITNLLRFKRDFLPIAFGILLSSLFLILTPYLTQRLVDQGILKGDMDFVYLILTGQLLVFAGSIVIDVVRNLILLRVGAKINMDLLSEFFHRLFKLPIHFFDTHLLGDLMQRTEDHKRVERLLTVKSFSVLMALVNLILLGSILFYYQVKIFLLFSVGSISALIWVLLFLKKRADLDYQFFEINAEQQGKIIENIEGVEEIKLSNSAHQKRWEWSEMQERLYAIKMKALRLDQMQQVGFDVIMRFTSIVLTVIAARYVIEGKLSIGAMFAINVIVGMLNSPIYSFVDFVPFWQDAKLGLRRINEINNHQPEFEQQETNREKVQKGSKLILKDLSFSYTKDKESLVLSGINLEIEGGKITAIVGASGSGKTTLMKLLLRFYQPTEGKIVINERDFEDYDLNAWRAQCGVVLQGGKIFSDTIAANIALGQELDMEQVVMTSALANLDDFVNSDLPMGYFTKIGDNGLQLSEGQKQRLLLARALYKNPDYLFLDEATSSLDTKNERSIMNTLQQFWSGKTAVVIAHRLSTVKNADKIIVLNKGRIVEMGKHDELIGKKGEYFGLIREQLLD